MSPGVLDAVDPAAAQARLHRTDHVHLGVVADVQHVGGGDPQALAGGVEDAGGRLGRAVLARAELEGEVVRYADPLQVGIAVAEAATGTRAAIRASASMASG